MDIPPPSRSLQLPPLLLDPGRSQSYRIGAQTSPSYSTELGSSLPTEVEFLSGLYQSGAPTVIFSTNGNWSVVGGIKHPYTHPNVIGQRIVILKDLLRSLKEFNVTWPSLFLDIYKGLWLGPSPTSLSSYFFVTVAYYLVIWFAILK